LSWEVVTEDVAVVVGDGEWGKVGFIGVDAADFLDAGSVEMDHAFFDFHRIPWQGDDPLNPGLSAVLGVEEGDEVVVPGLAVTVAVFAHEDFVTFIEGWAHRVAGHGEDVQKVFADGESQTGDDAHHEEGESDIDGKTVVVFEAIVFATGEGQPAGVPCGIGGGDECENDDGDEKGFRWGGLGRKGDDGDDKEGGEGGELKKTAAKGAAIDLSETG
jgi:hypothetical protein